MIRSTLMAAALALLLAPFALACQTDRGLCDVDEGPAEEIGEEIDRTVDEVEDAIEN